MRGGLAPREHGRGPARCGLYRARVTARRRHDRHSQDPIGGDAPSAARRSGVERLMSTTEAPQPSSLSAPRTCPPTWATEPFVHGTPAQFTRLREWLMAVGYTEPALCAVAKISHLAQLPRLDSSRTAFLNPVDAQSLLVQLFLDGRAVPWTTVQAVLSP